jgi:hypothetical protein
MVLSISNDRISTLTRFGDHGIVARFGLPPTLDDDRSH